MSGYIWPGSGEHRTNIFDAAVLWAFSINKSVFEDGSKEGACHPAAAVFPPVILLSEGKSWQVIEKAIIVGYDVMVRIARCGNPEFTQRGFHPTAITASFAAAAVTATFLGYHIDQIEHSICLAAMASSGLMASFKAGETQPLQVAWSVRNGMAAAFLAGSGLEGNPDIFEDGFFKAFLGDIPRITIDHPLEYGYAIMGSYLKPYPGCRHLHPPIDALTTIMKTENLIEEQIREIRVGTYQVALETEIHELEKRGDAYFNIPYALAALLVLGKCNYFSFDETHFTSSRIINLIKKVNVYMEPEVDRYYPDRRGAVVSVFMKDGKKYTSKIEHSLGEPENFLSVEVTKEKFIECAKPFISENSMQGIISILEDTGPNEQASALFKKMSEFHQNGRSINEQK